MKHSLVIPVLLLAACTGAVTLAQERPRDRGVFVEPRSEFADSMRKEIDAFKAEPKKPRREFRVDFSRINAPASPDEFVRIWHSPPVSQGQSGMCWCFATTSFFESEIYRLTRREIKLSELHTVYWEYVEKARRFVRERGESEFGEGSEANAVPRIWRRYGVVPAAAYTGLKPGQKFHDHRQMFREMSAYLVSVKESNAWNEEQVLSTVKAILNTYIGEPPTRITVEGKSMSPVEYLNSVLRLNLDDYISIMSLMQSPYFTRAEFTVPDNWWRDSSYANVPLDLYLNVVNGALAKGYSVVFGGDVSEPGYEGHAGMGVIPTFDIPSGYIDENARQFRFSNRTTTDDHFIHCVGNTVKEGQTWLLIKDSAGGSRNSSHSGYFFYMGDYVKLKILCLMVHKDVAQEIVRQVR